MLIAATSKISEDSRVWGSTGEKSMSRAVEWTGQGNVSRVKARLDVRYIASSVTRLREQTKQGGSDRKLCISIAI